MRRSRASGDMSAIGHPMPLAVRAARSASIARGFGQALQPMPLLACASYSARTVSIVSASSARLSLR